MVSLEQCTHPTRVWRTGVSAQECQRSCIRFACVRELEQRFQRKDLPLLSEQTCREVSCVLSSQIERALRIVVEHALCCLQQRQLVLCSVRRFGGCAWLERLNAVL